MRYVFVLLLAACTVMVASAARAEDGEKSLDKMDGKELYKSECRPCHTEDSEYEEYTPMTLIADQWDEFFDEIYLETHADVKAANDESKKITEVLTDELTKKIRKFCVDHAADSEQPMTCG